MKTSLAGKVALVAGATRGAGRGIAVQFGAAASARLSPACVPVDDLQDRHEQFGMGRGEPRAAGSEMTPPIAAPAPEG